MTLKEVLKHRNVDNKVYISDIKNWLKCEIDPKAMYELQDKLSEVSKGKNG